MSEEVLFHPADVVCFGGDTHPVTAVTATGDTQFWLLDLQHFQHCCGHCCGVEVPAHERLGKLPREYRRRVSRCQHARGDWRCSRDVPPTDTHCWQHRTAVR